MPTTTNIQASSKMIAPAYRAGACAKATAHSEDLLP